MTDHVNERLIDVGTARLATSDHPPERTTGTIVALHAGVCDRRSWEGCQPRWTAAGWRVVAYDRRGFGTSEWDEGLHDPMADLLAVLDHCGTDDAVLVGNSMGGGLAIDTALANPDRVTALVLVGSAISGQPWPSPGEPPAAEGALAEQIGAAEAAGDLDEVNRLECHYWLDGPTATEGRVPEPARSVFLDMNGRALAAPPTGHAADHPPAWPHLGDITVPTLVVVGDLDEYDVIVGARGLAERIPNARLVEMAGSAHLPSLDATAAFAQVVGTFLDELS